MKIIHICKCGCMRITTNPSGYILGHNRIGKPAYNKGMHWKIREDSPKKLYGLSDEHRKHLCGKGRPFPEDRKEYYRKIMRGNKKCGRSGSLNPGYGKIWTLEERQKRSQLMKGRLLRKTPMNGSGNPNWKGGLSFEPYTKEFNNQLKELIRIRDAYICQLCGIPESELDRKLSIHHIDYIKTNSIPTNLISLCHNCNVKANYNREYWTDYFRNVLNNRQINPKSIVIKKINVKTIVPKLEVQS